MRWFRRRRSAPLPPREGSSIGDLLGPVARIDRAGTVVADDGSWSLEWGVRGGDGWLRASEQRAVRQHRVAETPVFETWMRVPGGDVIQRVGVSNYGTGRALVVCYENASPDAVVVATVLAGSGRLRVDRSTISRAGTVWARSERDAGGVAVGEDIWAAVSTDPTVTTADGRNGAALLVPVPHRQQLTITVAIDGPLPETAPTPAELAAGWRQVTDSALSMAVPDEDLEVAWRRVIGDLVLAAGSNDPVEAGEAAWWLDVAGLPNEAERGRRSVLEAVRHGALSADGAVVALRALASGELRGQQETALAEVAGPLARIAGSNLDRSTTMAVARALERRTPEAAADAEALAGELLPGDRAMVSSAAAGAERVLSRVIAVDDSSSSGVLHLLPGFPESWQGQSVDVRGIVTGHGTLSFSVRWHGARPALLWERHGGPDEVVVCCPALDPNWATRTRSGDALLGEH